MTPLEINKKIAQLKELPVEDWVEGAKVDPPFYEMVNWAENIDDAFELFSEMHNASLLWNTLEKKYVCGANFSRTSEPPVEDIHKYLRDLVFAKEDTASLAISQCWLKWKEKNA